MVESKDTRRQGGCTVREAMAEAHGHQLRAPGSVHKSVEQEYRTTADTKCAVQKTRVSLAYVPRNAFP